MRGILLDARASLAAREAARETLLELLEATRSNGRPAYSLQLPAAKALLNDPSRKEIPVGEEAASTGPVSGSRSRAWVGGARSAGVFREPAGSRSSLAERASVAWLRSRGILLCASDERTFGD